MKQLNRMLLFAVSVVCLCVLAWTPAGRTQELTATLSGTVTDTSGAVIPNAKVVITLNGVNASRAVQTDGSGYFTATNLAAGSYTVSISVEGFAPYTAKDVVLDVAQKRGLNVSLKAGSLSTTVTVEDNPVAIDVESSSQAGTISGVQVRELEISNRNFENLVQLQPGVVNAGMGDEAALSNTGLAVNGARASANNWTVDGADINDSGSNQTVVNAPSIDAIQEFTLQRGTYDAGYGRSGGGQVLVSTKSGTSKFHGGAYEFVRNTDLNANEWFNKRDGGTRPAYHRNDFGYTIGGPLYIPNHYNANKTKTFFFWSQEWQKMITPSTRAVAAADANEVTGLISEAPLMDPTTNTATGHYQPYVPTAATSCAIVTNNTGAAVTSGGVTIPAYTDYIPSTCWSKNSTVYNKDVFGLHTSNAGSNYQSTVSGADNPLQEIARIDHYFSDALHLFVRGMYDSIPSDAIGGLWTGGNAPGLTDDHINTPGYNMVGNLSWTISPRMVNELELVYAQGNYKATPFAGQFFNASAGLTNNYAYTDPYQRNPNVSIGGVASYGGSNAPYAERNLDRTIFDNFTYTVGRHTLRAGFQFQQMLKTENGTGGNASFGFQNSMAGTVTGNTYSAPVDWSYGDFLLGQVISFSQASQDVIPDLRYINSELYIQDDWKINNKLTVNLGVRWSRYPSPSDAKNMLVNFDPLAFKTSQAAVIDPASGNFAAASTILPSTYDNGLIFPTGGDCAAAQKINATQATCSPYGAGVNPNYSANFAPRIGFAYNPDGRGKTSVRGGFGLFYDRTLNGMWEDDAFDNPGLVSHTAYSSGSFDNITGGTAAAPSYGPNALFATGTPELKVPDYANYNLSVQRQLLPTTILEVAYVGNEARHLLGQYDENQPTLAARQANTTANVNYLRPYAGWGAIDVEASVFTNSYNSLQISASHRAHGLTLAAAYTWSKDLTTNSNDRGGPMATDSYNLKSEYGPSQSNTPQVAEFNYVYDLPFYATQQGIVGHIAGGWEISGITSFISGASTTVYQSTDPFANGNGGLGLNAGQCCWFDYIGIRPNQSGKVSLKKNVNEWFDTSAFSAASNAFGTEKNGSFLGPGSQRWDFAAIKNVNLGEFLKFQLRSEFFNVFNHESFGAFSGNGVGQAVGTSYGTGSFGQVTGGHDPRIIQIAGKLIF